MNLELITPDRLNTLHSDLVKPTGGHISLENVNAVFNNSLFAVMATKVQESESGIVNERDLERSYVFISDTPPSYIPEAVPDWKKRLEDPDCTGLVLGAPHTLYLTDYVFGDVFAAREAIDTLLTAVYASFPHADQIVHISTTTNSLAAEVLEGCFTEVEAEVDGKQWSVLFSDRDTILPRLTVRPALEEDFDDLLPIFDEQAAVLTSRYGEFFLADIIRSTTPGDYSFVGELASETAIQAAGFVSMSKLAILNDIRESFDTTGFEGMNADNAYSLNVVCIDADFESRAVDFIRTICASIKECTYLVLTLPATILEFPLLDLFTRLPRKHNAPTTSACYIHHRNVLSLLPGLAVPEPVVDGSNLKFEVLAGAETIGEISGALFDVDMLTKSFHMPSAGPDATSRLLHVSSCTIPPHLFPLGRAAFQMVFGAGKLHGMLCSDGPEAVLAYTLTWPLRPQTQVRPSVLKDSAALKQLATTTAASDVEAADLKMVQKAADASSANAQAALLHAPEQIDHAMRLVLRRELHQRKVVANRPIIVVGTGDATWALLEHLMTTYPFIYWPNIVAVGPGGMQHEGKYNLTQPAYTESKLRRLGLPQQLTSLDGFVVGIDREAKAVLLADASQLYYDTMVITEVTADQTLVRLGVPPTLSTHTTMDVAVDEAVVEIIEDVQQQSKLEFTRNVVDTQLFSPKNSADVEAMVKECIRLDSESKIAVYGQSVQAYAAASVLIEAGVEGGSIALLVPKHVDAPPVFDWDVVQERVDQALTAKGVDITRGMVVNELQLNEDGVLTGVIVQTPADLQAVVLEDAPTTRQTKASARTVRHEAARQTVPCRAFVSQDVPNVDPFVFGACNSTSMVYDGGLVINGVCETSDPTVLACSSMAKLSRRCGITVQSPADASPVECGQALGTRLSELVTGAVVTERASQPIIFDYPVSTVSKVGGGMYIHITEPTSPVKRTIAETIEQLTDDILVRLQFTSVHGVMVISALTMYIADTVTPRPDPAYFFPLIGMPDAMLHNVISRSRTEGFNLYSYLHEPWLSPLLCEDVNMMLGSLGTSMEKQADVRNIVDQVLEGTLEGDAPIESRLDPETVQMIRRELFGFFNRRKARYPAFAFPRSDV
ncbi:hypothetical protein J8273_2023 [Carpediemonas membranifera]|uniref:Cilia- and flagella-associated protein 61 N-terminal domain-containing protein n=1 Tax=Carpediemonas membranifera TaxID=201153 RepID=A0A8J6E5U0_9EUKA|nr:hypothetical protein J8273_2023 [Carpediemonas membranifera]|eukprot:KAG9396292.1 hypothetical protein J8273_2023 [Carpediemonas membranifera]